MTLVLGSFRPKGHAIVSILIESWCSILFGRELYTISTVSSNCLKLVGTCADLKFRSLWAKKSCHLTWLNSPPHLITDCSFAEIFHFSPVLALRLHCVLWKLIYPFWETWKIVVKKRLNNVANGIKQCLHPRTQLLPFHCITAFLIGLERLELVGMSCSVVKYYWYFTLK